MLPDLRRLKDESLKRGRHLRWQYGWHAVTMVYCARRRTHLAKYGIREGPKADVGQWEAMDNPMCYGLCQQGLHFVVNLAYVSAYRALWDYNPRSDRFTILRYVRMPDCNLEMTAYKGVSPMRQVVAEFTLSKETSDGLGNRFGFHLKPLIEKMNRSRPEGFEDVLIRQSCRQATGAVDTRREAARARRLDAIEAKAK